MASNKEEVKVFGLVESPFVTRVEIALKLKGVEYKYEKEKFGNLSDTLKKYNPVYKKVPVFIHNDKPIAESLVILEYIDETWKQNPILPSDPSKRALARFWTKLIDDKVITPLFYFLCNSSPSSNIQLQLALNICVSKFEILGVMAEPETFSGGATNTH